MLPLITADTNYLHKFHFDLFGIVGLDDELLIFGAEDFAGQQISIFQVDLVSQS